MAPSLAPIATPAAAPPVPASPDDAAKRARIEKSARDYEGAFLSVMLGQMFEGVKASTFGGGEGEDAFKSFLTDAMAKQMAKHGGIGLSKSLTASMLKMQGLPPAPPTTQAAISAYTQSALAGARP